MKNDMFLKGELFEIPKKANLGEDLLFLINAIGDDWTRPFTTIIKVEKERLYTTDGMRLHILTENKMLSEGQYKLIAKSGKTYKLVKMIEEVNYPDIDKLIPNDEPLFTTDVEGLSESEFFHMLFSFPEKTAMKKKYFDDLSPSRADFYKVEWRDENHMLVFKSDKRMALVMPMRVE